MPRLAGALALTWDNVEIGNLVCVFGDDEEHWVYDWPRVLVIRRGD